MDEDEWEFNALDGFGAYLKISDNATNMVYDMAMTSQIAILENH